MYTETEIHEIVSSRYSNTADNASENVAVSKEVSKEIGYSEIELNEIPVDSNMGLGCGNPTAIASLKEGEVVVDLGCGGGLDVFLASKRVGRTGKVIGVDMTEKMIDLAKRNAQRGGYENVDFLLSQIEKLSDQIKSSSVDVVISNCVLNLVPNKLLAFEEIYKVLKPTTGRIVASDIILKKELPEFAKSNPVVYTSCMGGAIFQSEYKQILIDAGFQNINFIESKMDLNIWKVTDLIQGSGGSSCCCGGLNDQSIENDAFVADPEFVQKLTAFDFNEYVASYTIMATSGA